MQTSQKSHQLYNQPEQIEPFCLTGPHFQVLNNNGYQETSSVSGQIFTLESSPANNFPIYNSPSGGNSGGSLSSNGHNTFSPQGSSQSCLSNLHYFSPENTYGSSSVSNEVEQVLREMEIELLGPGPPGSDYEDGSITSSYKMLQMGVSNLDLKQLLVACAHAMDHGANQDVSGLMEVLQTKVSVSGDPVQRLGAYVLEGLKARQLSSGSVIYKKLKCIEPTAKELMSYMSVLYKICPYYKFAYASANVVIKETMQYENDIHVIDFLIAQGSQWVQLMEDLARRPGGPPRLRVTGVDDVDSAHARAGGLELVGQRLAREAAKLGVPFEFHGAARSGSEVDFGNLRVRPGEAIAVNFPYMLHHMPDESVSTVNHRDRLIHLVKSLGPKVVTLLEQESNTNTSSFSKRFEEALDYYTAMFESIDAGPPREDRVRISAEEHCVARDMVNIIACEDNERVERHELLAKWRFRLQAAGFTAQPLSYSVATTVQEVLKEYSKNYWLEEREGALVLGWKYRPMVTCSAWR